MVPKYFLRIFDNCLYGLYKLFPVQPVNQLVFFLGEHVPGSVSLLTLSLFHILPFIHLVLHVKPEIQPCR